MEIEVLLAVLAELRVADMRLTTTPIGSRERAAAMRDIHRLERIAFADTLRPAAASRRPARALSPA